MDTYWAFVHGIFMSILGSMKNNLQKCPGDKLWLLYDINLDNTPFKRKISQTYVKLCIHLAFLDPPKMGNQIIAIAGSTYSDPCLEDHPT